MAQLSKAGPAGEFRLLKLPPYAPELNSAENIWKYLRGNALSFQVWETYDAIVDACCGAWNGLMRTPKMVRPIASRDWARSGLRAAGITRHKDRHPAFALVSEWSGAIDGCKAVAR